MSSYKKYVAVLDLALKDRGTKNNPSLPQAKKDLLVGEYPTGGGEYPYLMRKIHLFFRFITCRVRDFVFPRGGAHNSKQSNERR